MLALAAIAWIPPVVVLLTIMILSGGPGAATSSVFATLVALHAAIVVGHAWAVPAMFSVLHRDLGARQALRRSARHLPVHALLGLPVVVVPFFAASVWPEIWGTVSEVIAVQVLAAMPFVIVCQMAWMQRVAEGSDTPTVAYDTWWLLRNSALDLSRVLVPAYVVLFGVLAANAVPVVTGPIAVMVATLPFTVLSWITWCRVAGAAPAWQAPARPVAAAAQGAAAAAAVDAPVAAPVLLGGGGPARLSLATGPGGAPAGAWLQLEERDTFTVTVRVPGLTGSDWAVYMWRPGAQWRELEQLWNDGRHVIAHGVSWGERAFVAVARRDGTPGVVFNAWISIATQAAAAAGAPEDSASTEAAA